MKFSEVRQLIREALLAERVFGKQAFVYHGSRMPPDDFLKMMVSDEFDPGRGAGAMYGKGLYTVYEADLDTNTFSGRYGDYVYKLKVNLEDFVIFDRDIATRVYGEPLSIPQQTLRLVKKGVIPQQKAVEIIDNLKKERATKPIPPHIGHSSDLAHRVYRHFLPYAKGIMFTGRQDGPVAVVYDPSSVVPVGWMMAPPQAGKIEWKKFDRDSIKGAVKRSAMGQFDPGRYSFHKKVRKIMRAYPELQVDESKGSFVRLMSDSTVVVVTDDSERWIDRDTGEVHRLDGPAVVHDDDHETWYRYGELHREGGPAITRRNGDREWWQNDRLHREDGPAVIYHNGTQGWYLNGGKLSEEEWRERTGN